MSDAEASTSTAPKPTVQFFKKARGRPQSSRKRSVSPEKPSTEDVPTPMANTGNGSAVIRPTTKATFTTPTIQGTKRLREDREKDRQKSEMEYRASEALKGVSEQAEFVTRSADWDLTGDEALAAKEGGAIKRPRLDDDGNLLPSDGMYRGKAGYAEYIRPDERTQNKMKAGPQKASSNIRSITVVDYQPDVCKDYKGM
jgi:RING finger protein 113A